MHDNLEILKSIKENYLILKLVDELGLRVNGSKNIKSIYKNENTPSLHIYEETNSYHCFATGRGGDVIQFYMDYFKISFIQAIEEMASKLALKSSQPFAMKQPLRIFNPAQQLIILSREKSFFDEQAGKYEFDADLPRAEAEKLARQDLQNVRKDIRLEVYNELYAHSDLTEEAFEYLTSDKRKLNQQSIHRFKLFSLDTHSEEFLRDRFDDYYLIVSGLFNKEGKFAFQRHRLIIPYIESGQIVSLRARYLEQNSLNYIHKYSSLFNTLKDLPTKRFFNIDTLKSSPTNKNLVITEGEFDCIRAEQLGIHAVGIAGVASFPVDLIHLLYEFQIYLAFDSDAAGETAVEKYSKLFNRRVFRLQFKSGKDLTEAT